jgi:hypothetical protein
MGRIQAWTIVLGTVLAVVATSWNIAQAAPDPTPPLVTAYADQMSVTCATPGGTLAPRVSPDRADLNGDGLLDWVFDSSRLPCMATSSMAKQYGALVTVFLATPDGRATPAFQKAAHGAHLEKIAGKARLVLTLAGVSCDEAKSETRCDRALNWRPETRRFDLATPITLK